MGLIPSVRDTQTHYKAECAAYIDLYGIANAHPEYPAYTGDMLALEDRAIDDTLCLDNGGEYYPELASLSLDERGGTLWLNWDETDRVRQYVLKVLGEESEAFAQFIVLMDLLEETGFQGGYWPFNPTYPYAHWSFTGVCSHPAQLKSNAQGFRTYIGCPENMLAVLPDFPIPSEEDFEVHTYDVYGFCTFPYAFSPAPGTSLSGHLMEIQTGTPGHGSDGFKFIHLYEFEEGELNQWQDSVDFTLVPDGIMIAPVNELGETIMEELEVPPLSTLIGVDRISLAEDADPPPPSALDVLLYVDQSFSEGKMVRLMFNTEGGERLHRYLLPIFSPLVPEDITE
jgi:hypothetical protein